MAEEEELWSKLPHEVTENILSRLSAFDIVRAACTCKRFRAFISSHRLVSSAFVSLLAIVDPFDIPWPDEEHLDNSVWAYDRSRDAWLNLSLGFLLPDLPVSPHPIASAGGLVCFGCCRDFVVCNPLTRSYRKLPAPPPLVHMDDGQSVEVILDEITVEAFGFTRNSITGTYELFALHHADLEAEKESRLLYYTSLQSQWRAMPSLVIREPGQLHIRSITPCNSALYTLWETGDSLVVYAFRNGCWTDIECPDGTSASLKASLMDVHGSLHMVGGVGSVWLLDDVWERPTSVRIWKLHMEKMEWIEVTRMPSLVLQEFRQSIDFDDLQWWGKNGMVFMKSPRSDVLMCDLAVNEWKWLKGLDLEVDLGGLIFEPSMFASA